VFCLRVGFLIFRYFRLILAILFLLGCFVKSHDINKITWILFIIFSIIQLFELFVEIVIIVLSNYGLKWYSKLSFLHDMIFNPFDRLLGNFEYNKQIANELDALQIITQNKEKDISENEDEIDLSHILELQIFPTLNTSPTTNMNDLANAM